MNFSSAGIDGLFVISAEPHKDARGIFYRMFCADEIKKSGIDFHVVQVNHSLTALRGTVRGMHYQNSPMAEAKIISCVSGSVFDVAVDVRRSSPTFLRWHAEILSAENMRMYFLPAGFAHGFQALEENTRLVYFHNQFYSPGHESGVRHDDPSICINWPLTPECLSTRDLSYPFINSSFAGASL